MSGVSGIGGSLASSLLQRLQNRGSKQAAENPADPTKTQSQPTSKPKATTDEASSAKADAEAIDAELGKLIDQLV